MARSTLKIEICFHLLLIVGIGFCSEVAVSDVEAKETVQNTSYAGSFIAIATVACAILVLFGCASFCPQRTNFKDYDPGPDAYFNDVTIGRPPAVDFAMYPPVESAPAVGSLPVYFEPLPDPSRLQQQRQTTSPAHSVSNASRLRPRIMHVNSEAMDNEGDCDIVDGNFPQRNWAQQEKLKLERLLGERTGV